MSSNPLEVEASAIPDLLKDGVILCLTCSAMDHGYREALAQCPTCGAPAVVDVHRALELGAIRVTGMLKA